VSPLREADYHHIADQIATSAKAKDLHRMRKGIYFELTRQWSLYNNMRDPPRLVKEKRWRKQTINRLKRFQRLSHDLCTCFESLGTITAMLPKRDQEVVLSKKLIAPLKELTARSTKGLSILRNPSPRRRGRSSSLRSGSFIEFTLRLLWHVRDAGGRLTLDKNTAGGTLTKTLETLRPHLPPNFIPQRLPLSTLEHIKQLDKKLLDKK
jgi:hypothetical protein